MHICFVVEGYPTKEDPFVPFIKALIEHLSENDIRCSVIAPQSLTRAFMHHYPVRPRFWTDHFENGYQAEIYQPFCVSLSKLAPKLNNRLFIISAKSAYKRVKNVDALYAHFWHLGVVASKLNEGKPLFVACGESKISVFSEYSKDEIEKLKSQLTGVIYVGRKSYNEAKGLLLQKEKPYLIAPNGFDPVCFHPMNPQKCRKDLGWPEDGFIVAFVGAFNNRKGVKRLSDALNILFQKYNCEIYACFIGEGSVTPDYSNTLYVGKLAHEEIVAYLNASDIFVLPTNDEGCCNSIVEAIACGLPIISSNQSFNDDILQEDYSIRIDPMNVQALAEAIYKLYLHRPMCEEMRKNALKKACELKLDERAINIANFIKEKTSI